MPNTTNQGPDPLIGRRFGSYVVQRKLGEGGMGAVYELVHPAIGKRQALKVLHAEYAKKASIVDRFFAEAKSVVTIGHPNIVDITDFATLDDGTAYIVMEFLEGQSLASYVKQRGPMTPHEMASLVLPICDALGAAHAHGIVHRDLKPENVHLVPRPDNPHYVKVLDFGIAKLATPEHGAGAAGPMTKTGQVMGTPTYMSPEQAMGRTREIDHRTDVYALGVMMYQLLAGEVPFQAESFGDLMLMHLQQPPPPLAQRRPDLPAAWDAIIRRALAKSRDERFGSMREIADAIRGALAGHGVAAPPPMVPTLAMPAAPAFVPPTQPAATAFAQGTAGAGSQPPGSQPPGTQPSWPPPSGAATPVAAAPPAKKSRGLAIGLAVVAVAAIAVVAIVVASGGKKPSTAAAGSASAAPIDARAVALPPDAAQVAIATPPDAALVVIDAAPEAPPDAAPEAPPDAAPAEPPHRTRVKDIVQPVKITPDGAKAKIRVTAAPWGNVFVDGKAYGQTPQVVEVPAGKPVKVRVVNPELNADQTQTVVGDPDKMKAVRFDFGAQLDPD